MASRSIYSESSGTRWSSRSSTGPTTRTRSQITRSRPQTAATSSAYHESEIICAVSEGRGIAPTVGLSFVNLSTSEAVLCQFADTQTYARTCHKIAVFEPSEIIIATTAADSKLESVLKENIGREQDDIKFTNVNRRYWSEAAGHDYLQRLAFPTDLSSLKLALAGQYFAVCCFAAILQYMDLSMSRIFAPQALRIRFEPPEGVMMIDTSTITSLELVQNLQNAKSKDCLFGLLNQTYTRMGNRMLKNNILQPSTDKTKILKRYQAIEELSTKEAMFFAVREALEGYVDTDKTLASLVIIQRRVDLAYMESSVNHVLMLKSFVDNILPLFQALAGVESEELLDIRELCRPDNYEEVQDLIRYALNEDVKYSTQAADLRNQRVFALKTGVNGFLDVARQTYKEIGSDIELMINELAEQHQLSLQQKFDPARHFFIRFKIAELEDREPPEVFINVFRRKDWIECQTLELMKLNQRHRDAHVEVISLSDESIQRFIDAVRSKIYPLFKISEAIGLLDMLASFAQIVTTRDYVRPELLEDTLAIKSNRHPIRDKIQQEKFIPNDVYATPQSRFQIITGCNMSGKSTYIRSIALTTIMAQIGSFVPADYAGFPIIHQVFARVSTDDSIEANVSSFSSEMREMAFILANIEPRSLVIVDELGRGTSTTDGLAIAIAISEALIESKAYVWFVTHFRDLPRILAERAGVVSLHLSVDIAADFSRMKMMYKIAPGQEEQKFYGLAMAKLMDFPKQVIENATEVSQYLNQRNEARKSNAKTLAVARRRKLVLTLKEQILQARESDEDDESLRPYLKKLQEEFMIRMKAIDAEVAAAEVVASRESSYMEVGSSRDRCADSVMNDEVNTDALSTVHSSVIEQHGTGNHVNDPIEVSTACTSPSTVPAEDTDGYYQDGKARFVPTRPELDRLARELSDDMIEDD